MDGGGDSAGVKAGDAEARCRRPRERAAKEKTPHAGN